MSSEDVPLPYGWVKEIDPRTQHPFWVDTKANPPRAIWVHPYDDEEYLNAHPEVKEKVGNMKETLEKELDAKPPRRHSYHDDHLSDSDRAGPSSPGPSSAAQAKAKRNFFGKIKDKAIGTKEEREAHKREVARLEAERRRQRAEMVRQRQELLVKQQAEFDRQQAEWMRNNPQPPPGYGPPQGNPYVMYGQRGYGNGYGNGGYGPQYGYNQNVNRGGFGFGGGGSSALPLLGGLAGGLLLGDLLF